MLDLPIRHEALIVNHRVAVLPSFPSRLHSAVADQLKKVSNVPQSARALMIPLPL